MKTLSHKNVTKHPPSRTLENDTVLCELMTQPSRRDHESRTDGKHTAPRQMYVLVDGSFSETILVNKSMMLQSKVPQNYQAGNGDKHFESYVRNYSW